MRAAVLDDYQDVALTLADWRSLAPDVTVERFADHQDDAEALVRRLAPFDIVVAMRERTPFPRALIERLPNLRLLVTSGMRNAAIDVAAAAERGIVISGTDMLPYPTAELTWGLILALARRLPWEIEATRGGAWQTTLGEGLNGKTLGLLGLGRLGAQVAAVGRAFGMTLLAWSPNLTPARAAECGAERVDKAELFARADFVTIHLVLGPRSTGLVGAAEFGAMKPGAYLVNTSRGPIVDEAALVDALRRGAIAGAALDVFDHEPMAADHPLRGCATALLTPHIGYVTRENYRQVFTQTVENIAAFRAGRPIRLLTPPPRT